MMKVEQQPIAAYTVARLRRMNPTQLTLTAKALAVDYKAATGENKEAIGNLIVFIRDLVAEKKGAKDA